MSDVRDKTIAFVVYPGFLALDVFGPLQVLSALGLFAPHVRTTTVAARRGPVPTDSPVSIVPEHTFGEVPDPFAVIVPGGMAGTMRAMADDELRAYLVSTAQTAQIVASVCTGALLLGAAGLLDGRTATTHWAYVKLLEKLGARYVEQRWVEDGKFLTSAGVTAGIDMALHLAAHVTDESTARLVQLAMQYDPEPPFGPIDWSGVDREMWGPMVARHVSEELAGHPDLLARLSA